MKYLSLILLLFLSKFTNGQNSPRVYTTFQNVVLFDDFSNVTNRWSQKNTSSEKFLLADSKYRIERIKNSYFSISLANDVDDLADFELTTTIEIEKNKENKYASGGIVLKAQRDGSGALIFEINNRKQFRFQLLKNGVLTPLFADKNDGWLKSKHLNKGGVNEIKIATKNSEFDVYINSKFERSIVEATFVKGRVGYYAAAQSAMSTSLFIVKMNGALIAMDKKEEKEQDPKEIDDTYTELVKVFKAKIDKQQADIERLNEELNMCKSSLTIDTTSANKVKTLTKENNELTTKLKDLEEALNKDKKRLAYLESMKEDIESQTNGDLILHLTKLLSDQKEENRKLEAEKTELLKEINQLRRGN